MAAFTCHEVRVASTTAPRIYVLKHSDRGFTTVEFYLFILAIEVQTDAVATIFGISLFANKRYDCVFAGHHCELDNELAERLGTSHDNLIVLCTTSSSHLSVSNYRAFAHIKNK